MDNFILDDDICLLTDSTDIDYAGIAAAVAIHAA